MKNTAPALGSFQKHYFTSKGAVVMKHVCNSLSILILCMGLIIPGYSQNNQNRTVTVTGKLMNRKGTAVADAVMEFRWGSGDSSKDTSLSAADGTFREEITVRNSVNSINYTATKQGYQQYSGTFALTKDSAYHLGVLLMKNGTRTYTILGAVNDTVTKQPIEGVAIEVKMQVIFDDNQTTELTEKLTSGKDGAFRKTLATEPTIVSAAYTATKAGSVAKTGACAVAGDTINCGTILLKQDVVNKKITFLGSVYDSATAKPVDSALIVVGTMLSSIPPDTLYSVKGVFKKEITVNQSPIVVYRITHPLYRPVSATIEINTQTQIDLGKVMLKPLQLSRKITISATVTDTITNANLDSAYVAVTIANTVKLIIDTIATNRNGVAKKDYEILVPVQTPNQKPFVTYTAIRRGYYNKAGKVDVSDTSAIVNLGTVKLRPTNLIDKITVSGTVVDSLTNTPLAQTQVLVTINTPSGVTLDSLVTDKNGSFAKVIALGQPLQAQKAVYANCIIIKQNYVPKAVKKDVTTEFVSFGVISLQSIITSIQQNPSLLARRYATSIELFSFTGKRLYAGPNVALRQLQTEGIIASQPLIVFYKYRTVTLFKQKLLMVR
ncbi:MAG: hypothetical protein JW795_16770 [Chitinivibrionales bacterium]|nr:hypothetical protein [Chitinivibrionales bacterium]